MVSLSGPGKYGPLLDKVGISLHCMNISPSTALSSFWQLTKLIRRLRPAAVQTWMYEADVFGGLAARFAGISNLHRSILFSTIDPQGIPSKMKWSIRASVPLSRILPKTIISCAHKAVEEHVKYGYSRKPWRVVHNGYDFSKTDYSEDGRERIRKEFSIPPNTKVVGMVARCDPQKDHESLLMAIESLAAEQEFHVLLVGRDVDTDRVLGNLVSASSMKGRIHRAGSRPDVVDIFSAMDIHVLASRFGEGFPNVVAEAMACGAWSISTDSGDATYILEDRGFLVPMRNSWALSCAINAQLRLMPKTKAARSEARAQNRAHVTERFSIDKMIREFHGVWFKSVA